MPPVDDDRVLDEPRSKDGWAAGGTRDFYRGGIIAGRQQRARRPGAVRVRVVAEARRADPWQGRLARYAPQSTDQPIGSELWRGVRVVAAGAAGAGALFAGAGGLRADGGTRCRD